MTHKMTLLVLQLAAILISAKILGFLVERYLKQPRVLGELAAGMIIGPYALGAIHLPGLEESLFPVMEGAVPVSPELYGFAVFASIVLLFIAGLETDLPTFLRFSGVGTAVGLGGVIVSFSFGALAAYLFLPSVTSLMDPSALFLGTLSTATSVGITARILSERRKMSSPEGVTILAAAVLDDVVGIIILAVVVGIAKIGGGETGTATVAVDWGRIGIIAAKAFGFWLGCTILGILFAPRITKGLKRFGSTEMVAGVAFGLALLLAGLSETAGLAMIIGAYVTGLALSQTDVAHEIQEQMHGLFTFVVPMFFCVMGMLVDFSTLPPVLLFGIVFSLLAMVGKLLGAGLPALLTGFNLRGALRIGAGMQPRGEVTLIVAGIGLSAGAIGQDLFGVAIMTLLISTVVAPPLLVASFKGGPGYKREVKAVSGPDLAKQIRIPMPGDQIAAFLRARILSAFRSEEFFVTRVDFDRHIYRVRKDEIAFTVVQEEGFLTINLAAEHEQFIRLLVLEEIVELTDLLDGLKKIQDPGSLGSELADGLFDDGAAESGADTPPGDDTPPGART
jgi:Na+:H+ antiporter